MSSLWVSHSSDSTGQMIALDKVFKIRTFKQHKDGRTLFRIVFETTFATSSQITWDFALKEAALATITRIATIVDPLAANPNETQIYTDLARGFD